MFIVKLKLWEQIFHAKIENVFAAWRKIYFLKGKIYGIKNFMQAPCRRSVRR